MENRFCPLVLTYAAIRWFTRSGWRRTKEDVLLEVDHTLCLLICSSEVLMQSLNYGNLDIQNRSSTMKPWLCTKRCASQFVNLALQ
ncbi:hypothetical protein RHGRI_021234 [Rhododendron griersonianum]|uniref:Uncharacterized protein n=1 Tax=Rhododendron griersonianum TaxID=479676 RepID=A0AAV6JJH4_9ERIC|nr:hypothetical protein RHGRI_021234 [Rhododendron griersonianum]